MKRYIDSSNISGMVTKLLLFVAFSFAGIYAANAQFQVMRVYGSGCVGADNYFAFTGSCSSVSWYVSSGGTIISQSNTTVQVRWNSPTGNAYVTANYSGCSAYPYGGSTSSSPISISNAVTPSVSITASATTVCATASGNVTYTAAPVNGGTSPYYSWQVNGSTVSSGSSNTFTRAISSTTNGDVIRVIMSANAPCMSSSSATSNSITMTVTQPTSVTATISGPQTICSGSSSGASFMASISGGSNPVYTFYKNGSPVTDQMSGPPSYVYVPTNPLNNGDRIKCRISFSGGCYSSTTVETNEYVVSLTSSTTPYVSIQIPGINLCSGNTITFSASSPYITGGSTYSWRLNGSQFATTQSTSLPISTSSSTPNDFSPGDVVTVAVTGLSGTCLTSSSATGTTSGIPFTFNNTVTPSVSISTASTTICRAETGNITFTATPVNGGSPSYAWQINGSTITTTTSNTFTRAKSSINNGDVVRVIMTASAPCMTTNTATSNALTMTVNQASTPSATLTGPSTICSGSSPGASFSVGVTNGGSNPVYTWLKNGSPVTDQLSGPPPYVYVPQNPLNNGDKIKCRISFSSASCLTSNPVESNEYTVSLTPSVTPYVSIQFPTIYYCSGSTISLTASSPYLTSGSTYSWQLNGSQFATTQSTSLPVTTDTGAPNAFSPGDVITLTVTGLSGTCLSSSSATATTSGTPFVITPLPTASISPNGSLKICSTCTQNITATSGSGYTYQWKLNGSNITSGGTVNPYSTSTAGTYTVVVTASGCSKESNSLVLTKNVRPVANAGLDKTITLPTNSTTLNGSGSDGDGTIASYTWTKVSGPSVTISGSGSANLSLTNLVAGTYVFRLVVTDNFGEASLPDDMTVTVVYPANNFNWIRETTVLVQNKLTESDVTSSQIQNGEKSVTWNYFDDLGRSMQSVTVQGSPLQKDVVVPMVYDAIGREHRKYLPVVINHTNGYYKDNTAIIDNTTGNYIGIAGGFYAVNSDNKIADDTRPFSETVFEPSPLNRPSKNFGPGSDWFTNNKAIAQQYLINKHGTGNSLTDEKIVAWKIVSGLPVRNTAVNSGSGYYPSGVLSIASTKDENGNEVREYKDKQGRLILKKVQAVTSVTSLNDNTQWALTYYIYDDLGNLRFVLQPELCKTILGSNTYNPSQTDLNQLAFQYSYDERNRLAEKKVPGAEPVYMIYDNRDRLVMTQDGNQRKDDAGNITKREWSFTKYDILNRPIITGTYTHSSVVDRTTMAGLISTTNLYETYNGTAATHGYTNTVFPTANIQVLTVTYYDNYKFRDDMAGASSYGYTTNDITGQEASANANVKGFITGTKVNVLGTSTYLWGVTYYDQKYRTIQTKMLNHKGGVDRVTSVYDFVRLKETRSVHNKGTASYSSHYRYEYDHAGRLTKVWHKFHTEPSFVLLQQNEYNELGELVTRKLHSRDNGSTFAQSTDNRYTIRGWIEKINDPGMNAEAGDLFSMELEYNQPSGQGGSAQFNGNISEMIWRSAGLDKQSYSYSYDVMNRLLEANYYNHNKPTNNGRYTERIGGGTQARPAYDLNGNIRNLIRFGRKAFDQYGKTDDLSYPNYTGNQVTRIDDSEPDTNFDDGFKGAAVNANNEYTYDWNGNMKKDQNKGLTAIEYNHLNLPKKVSRNATEYITYTYDATGKKLAQQVFGSTPKTTDYINEFVYENDALQYIFLQDVRIVPDNSPGAPRPWEYQYFLKDHLNNVRVVFSEKKTSTEHKATLENDRKTLEQATFRNYSQNNFTLFNHTTGTGYSYSQLLNAGNNSQVGLAKSFAVNPGDVVDLEVFAKYEAPTSNSTNVNTLLAALASAFSLGTSGNPLESVQAYNAFSGVFTGGGPWITSDKWEDDVAPKAYLNYILFNESFQLIDFGFDQISVSAKQVGTSPVVPHDYLSLHVNVQQKGYLYVYLSNESPVQTNVYFDDLKITYHTGVEQINDYYPFGHVFQSFNRPNGIPNDIKFQGQETTNDLALNWIEFRWRNYDPATGRFFNVDPLAEKFYYNSPYAFSENKVTSYVELEGLEGVQIHEFTKDEEGNEKLSKIIYQLDVYVVTGTSGDNPSKFTESDVEDIQSYLNSAFSGEHKDPSTGVPVVFQFCVEQLDFSQTVTKKNGKQKEVSSDMSDRQARNEVVSRGQAADNAVTSFPALIFATQVPGTDGGQTGVTIKVDLESSEGAQNAVSHEVLHFMLGRYQQPKRDTNNLHHNLGGLLGRPFGSPNINKDILNKLRQYVPRSSQLDIR